MWGKGHFRSHHCGIMSYNLRYQVEKSSPHSYEVHVELGATGHPHQ